jgi:hypothetical protein
VKNYESAGEFITINSPVLLRRLIMRRSYVWFLICMLLYAPLHTAPLTLLDTIEVVIETLEGTEIITQSDTSRPALQGTVRTVDELVFESLVYLDAKKHKVEPDEDAVDRYLAKIMQENGLNVHELEEVFRQGGRTLKEGREELRKMQAVNGMMDFKIRSNVIVPKKEVEAFYADNPEYEPAQYQLQYALVAYDKDVQSDEQKKQLEQQLARGHTAAIRFGNPFWVDAQDLAQERQIIGNLKKGETIIFEASEGFEVYRMCEFKERRLRTLQERYRDIASLLMQPKYQQMMEDYRKQLLSGASLLYFR